jgi:hypothetical protein
LKQKCRSSCRPVLGIPTHHQRRGSWLSGRSAHLFNALSESNAFCCPVKNSDTLRCRSGTRAPAAFTRNPDRAHHRDLHARASREAHRVKSFGFSEVEDYPPTVASSSVFELKKGGTSGVPPCKESRQCCGAIKPGGGAGSRTRSARCRAEPSSPVLVHKSAVGRGSAAIAVCQAMRCDTGMPSRVIRLSTEQATRASVFWLGRVRARRPRPMMVLYRNTAVSPSERLP